MTKEERHLWYDFLKRYPVRFLRQKVIDNYIVDFYCHSARLIIELDGSQHYEDNGIENDKQMRNRGWMKAPDTYGTKYNSQEVSAREDPRCLRKIIHRQYLGAGEHWLRLRDIPAENWESFQVFIIYLDYIELVPLHIVSDPTKPEDRH